MNQRYESGAKSSLEGTAVRELSLMMLMENDTESCRCTDKQQQHMHKAV